MYRVPDSYSQRGKHKDGMDLTGEFTEFVQSYVARLGTDEAVQNLNKYLGSLS